MEENGFLGEPPADGRASSADYLDRRPVSMLDRPSPRWPSVYDTNPLPSSSLDATAGAERDGLLFYGDPGPPTETMPSLLGAALSPGFVGRGDLAGVEAQVEGVTADDADIAAPAGAPAVAFNELGFTLNEAERARLRREQAMLSRGMAPMTYERRIQALRGGLRSVADGFTDLLPYVGQGAYLLARGPRDIIAGDAWEQSKRFRDQTEQLIERGYSALGIGVSEDPDFQEAYLLGSLATSPVRGIARGLIKGAQLAVRHPKLTAAAAGGITLFTADDAEAGISHDLGRQGEEAWYQAMEKQKAEMIGRHVSFYVVDDSGNPVVNGRNGRLRGVMDGVAIFKDGRLEFNEVKNGNRAGYTDNQWEYIDHVKKGNIIFYGSEARRLGIDGLHVRMLFPDFNYVPNIGPLGAERFIRQIMRGPPGRLLKRGLK